MTHLCKSVLKISIINDVLESLQRQTKSISNHDFKKEVKGHPTLVHVPELAPEPPLGTFKDDGKRLLKGPQDSHSDQFSVTGTPSPPCPGPGLISCVSCTGSGGFGPSP